MNNSSFKIGMILVTVKKPMICTSFGTFEASHAPNISQHSLKN